MPGQHARATHLAAFACVIGLALLLAVASLVHVASQG
jgi:hypothetical protein